MGWHWRWSSPAQNHFGGNVWPVPMPSPDSDPIILPKNNAHVAAMLSCTLTQNKLKQNPTPCKFSYSPHSIFLFQNQNTPNVKYAISLTHVSRSNLRIKKPKFLVSFTCLPKQKNGIKMWASL